MKKFMFVLLMIFMFGLGLNVDAANEVATEDSSNYSSLQTQYNKGVQTTTINGSGTVTLYGYSSCTSSGCDYTYAKKSSDFKEVLRTSVVCSGGEGYITYQVTGGADGYKTSNSAGYTGNAYWSEDFIVTCTNDSTSGNVEKLENSNAGNNGGSTNEDNSNGGNTNSGTSSGSEYDSSSTVDSEETGVETYYIVLGIVAIITYVSMVVIKKYNLFKNI